MMIALNSRARKRGGEKGVEVKREYEGIRGEEEGNANYRRMVAICCTIKGVECGNWAREV